MTVKTRVAAALLVVIAMASGPATRTEGFLAAAEAAEQYYVDIDSIGGAASDSNPGTITQPWATISKANATVQAGDTVYLRGGEYQEIISPQASGTELARITYCNHASEKVLITVVRYAVDLVDQAYVTVDGIDSDGTGEFVRLRRSHHIWIQNGTFANSSMTTGWPVGFRISQNSHHNRVHHCVISRCGYATSEDNGGIMNLGYWGDEADRSDYNLIQNNTLAYGGHHVMEISSSYNVIRNNRFHNEEWMDGPGGVKYGNRHIVMYAAPDHATFNLIEGNNFAFCGMPPDALGVSGVSIRTPRNIVRRNIFYDNDCAGLNLCTSSPNAEFSVQPDVCFNHVYNNVFFHNAYAGQETFQPFLSGLSLTKFTGDAPVITDVSIKNNIFWQNNFDQAMTFYYVDRNDLTVSHNWEEAGDPLFVDDETPADPLDPDLLDFHLQPQSPCVNAGDFLTRTTTGGSGTVMPVADALYFMDGWGIIEGDVIQLEGQTERARILSVDYGSNELTMDRSLTWSADQGVAYPYEGPGPDMGIGTNPYDIDSDGDGMTDGWEVDNLLDPTTDDASGDIDGDGATNYDEFLAGSDPHDPASLPRSAEDDSSDSCASGGSGGSAAAMMILLACAMARRLLT